MVGWVFPHQFPTETPLMLLSEVCHLGDSRFVKLTITIIRVCMWPGGMLAHWVQKMLNEWSMSTWVLREKDGTYAA